MVNLSLEGLIDSAMGNAQYLALIPILLTMGLVTFAVGKLWDKDWHMLIKVSMLFVVFVVNMGAIAVMPGTIGSNFRSLWGKLFGTVDGLI